MLRLAEDGMNKFTIVFQRCEEGGFTAQIKEVPGAISEGETAREAAENVFDALVQILAAQAEEQLKDLDETPKEIELALS
jgi:predicted RNase H-like HicB family nuclease